MRPEALELYSQIELVIAEVQSLRLGGRLEQPSLDDPEWSKNLPWATG